VTATGGLKTKLIRSLPQILQAMKASELLQALWAAAELGVALDAEFTDAILQRAANELASFSPQELANTAHTLAKLGHIDAAFMRELLVTAEPKLSRFTAQALSNTAWALATLGHSDPAFMDALLAAAQPTLGSWNCQDLSNMAWALATLGHVDAAFMGALLQAARPKLRHLNAQALADTAWALATLAHHNAAFMGALMVASRPKLCHLNSQALANTAWALAALDERNTPFAKALIQQMQASVPAPQLRQMFQFVLWLDTWQVVGTDVPSQLLEACEQAWLEEVGNPTVSPTQLQVLDEIRHLPGCSGATSGHLTDDGLFSIDIAVQLPGAQKLAVQVDGPTHFLRNAPRAQRRDAPAQPAARVGRLARRERAGDGVGQAGFARLPGGHPGSGWLGLCVAPARDAAAPT
jgi:ABC-type transporter Mla MlaB component